MVDIGRISSRKGAIALLVFLCLSAVLFITPWMLSVFYDTDPYENWNEEEEVRFNGGEEEGGNMTLLCSSGPCVACTSSEKANANFKCSPTGYHKAQQCTPNDKFVGGGSSDGSNSKLSKKATTKDPVLGKDRRKKATSEGLLGIGQQQTMESFQRDGSINKRRQLLAKAGAVQKTRITYKTCIPLDVKEKLSVFGFEGVVLVCLLISAPAVHYRKKRGGASAQLQRISSTARF